MKLVSLLLAAALLAVAQAPTFRTDANIVLVPVVVRDGSGKAVGGLGRDDFRLLEDGQQRSISHLTVERRDVSSPLPGQYDVYIFDDLHLRFQDLERARVAFEHHLSDTTLQSRRIAVLTTSSSVAVRFTNSREAVLDAVRRIKPRAALHTGTECPEVSYYLAEQITKRRDRIALGIVMQRVGQCMKNLPPNMARQIAETEAARILRLEGDRTKAALAILGGAVERLQTAPGGRSVVLVSSGFHLGDDKERQALSAILASASRHRVAVHAVNAFGVQWTGVDATMRDAADWLRTAADRTGGTYIGNSNDTESGLRQIAEPPEFTYVLAFTPRVAGKRDTFHKLEVKLPGKRGLTIQAREGYYESPPLSAVDHVRALLFTHGEMRQIGLGFEVVGQRVTASIDANALSFTPVGGKHRSSVTAAFALFDPDGRVVAHTVRQADMHLDGAALSRLRQHGLRLTADLEGAPGAYTLRIAVREDATGKTTALSRAVAY